MLGALPEKATTQGLLRDKGALFPICHPGAAAGGVDHRLLFTHPQPSRALKWVRMSPPHRWRD